jgi:hypothetical protein
MKSRNQILRALCAALVAIVSSYVQTANANLIEFAMTLTVTKTFLLPARDCNGAPDAGYPQGK